MFANTKAFSGFAVDDLEAAERFYRTTLGIDVSWTEQLLTLELAGGRDTLIYLKARLQASDLHDPELRRRARRGDSQRTCLPRCSVRTLRRLRPGREGHLARRGRPVHRLVQGSGRKHPLGTRGTLRLSPFGSVPAVACLGDGKSTYRYELRRGDEIIATGRMTHETPLNVGDRITIGRAQGIVRQLEPTR